MPNKKIKKPDEFPAEINIQQAAEDNDNSREERNSDNDYAIW